MRMKNGMILLGVLVAMAMGLSGSALADPATTKPADPAVAALWAQRMILPSVQLNELVTTIQRLNMRTDFTLTVDQKQQIIDITDDWADTNKTFAANLRKLTDALNKAAASGDAAATAAARKACDVAEANAPSADDSLAKVRAVLTHEQLVILTAEEKHAAEAARKLQDAALQLQTLLKEQAPPPDKK